MSHPPAIIKPDAARNVSGDRCGQLPLGSGCGGRGGLLEEGIPIYGSGCLPGPWEAPPDTPFGGGCTAPFQKPETDQKGLRQPRLPPKEPDLACSCLLTLPLTPYQSLGVPGSVVRELSPHPTARDHRETPGKTQTGRHG